MRLAFCYVASCRVIEKLDDFDIDFNDPRSAEHDVLLTNWIERHMHGLGVDSHPGGRIFNFDDSRANVSKSMPIRDGVDLAETGLYRDASGIPALEMDAVQQVKATLAQQQIEVFEYRDQLRDDAGVCFVKHHNPEAVTRPCIDYRSGQKALGRKDTPPQYRQYLCTYCPYESSVTVEKRHRRGDYAR